MSIQDSIRQIHEALQALVSETPATELIYLERWLQQQAHDVEAVRHVLQSAREGQDADPFTEVEDAPAVPPAPDWRTGDVGGIADIVDKIHQSAGAYQKAEAIPFLGWVDQRRCN